MGTNKSEPRVCMCENTSAEPQGLKFAIILKARGVLFL